MTSTLPCDDRVFVSSGAFNSRNVQDMLREAEAAGCDRIELSSGLAYASGNLDVLRSHTTAFNFLVHNYFPPPSEPFVLNLAAPDEEGGTRSMEHCRRAMALTAEFGGGFYSVHAGFTAAPKVEQLGRPFADAPRMPRERAFDRFVERVRILTAEAADLGLRFFVENNVVAPFNLGRDDEHPFLCAGAEEILMLADRVGSPAFGILVDVGHLKVSAQTLGFGMDDWLRRVQPFVGGFHLSDNDGTADTNLPFGDDAWFLPYLQEWPEATLVLEAYRLDKPTLTRNLDTIRKALRGPDSVE